jgi:hypothetical protein
MVFVAKGMGLPWNKDPSRARPTIVDMDSSRHDTHDGVNILAPMPWQSFGGAIFLLCDARVEDPDVKM